MATYQRYLFLPTIVLIFGASASAQHAISSAKVRSDFGNLPLYFEKNQGQAPSQVRYIARTGNVAAFISNDGLTFRLGDATLAMRVDGASPNATFTPEGAVAGISNYYLGARTLTGVTHYSRVRARDIRRGIDLVYGGSGHDLEYDFVIRPGADPEAIRLRFAGAQPPTIDDHGDLLFKLVRG